jgi:signal transduction histidine kinase
MLRISSESALLSEEIGSSSRMRSSRPTGSKVQLMPRWPALARRVRRPSPLLADVALALVLAAFSVLTIETQSSQSVSEAQDTELRITPVPITPGDPVEITVRKGGKPYRLENVRPLLTVQNVSTGAWRTYVARPTAEPGVYRVPAVYPGEGAYSYSVLYGPFEQNVRVRGPSDPPAAQLEETSSGSDSFPIWHLLLTLLATLPIAVRRRFPLLVFLATLPTALVADVLYDSFQFAGALVALYTVAAYVGRPGSIGVAVGTALALPLTRVDDSTVGIAETAATYVIFAVAWVVGDRIGARRAYLRELEESAERHERERTEHARRAAAEEQARIARELHDIIAHNVSVMTVQAAAAGDAFETRPDRAREALGSIESTGREALTELRRLLGGVGPGDGTGTFAPQPRLVRLDALIEQVRAAGLDVELTVEGDPQQLPPGVDLSAYRIVQEALTNTLKHAGASKARVLVRYGSRELELEIVDDGRGATDRAEGGHGIIGLRERAALVGGELQFGPAQGGGFFVRARIPLEEAVP